jgi:hypothetical protein
MKTVAVLIALLVSAPQCALAGDLASVPEVVIRGVGAADCATFAKNYKERPDDEYMLLITWITGYLSGLNMNSSHRKNLKSFNIDRAVDRIKVFCDQHPLLYFGEQLDAMWNDLPSIKDTAH